jgi:homoaconitase/3-isopropylmalate dehydratase large subunit
MSGLTLYDKVWSQHVVKNYDDCDSLIYIDRHLVQEVSSPQAFAGLITENRILRRPERTSPLPTMLFRHDSEATRLRTVSALGRFRV